MNSEKRRESIIQRIQDLPETEILKLDIFLAGLSAGVSQIQEQPAEQADDEAAATV